MKQEKILWKVLIRAGIAALIVGTVCAVSGWIAEKGSISENIHFIFGYAGIMCGLIFCVTVRSGNQKREKLLQIVTVGIYIMILTAVHLMIGSKTDLTVISVTAIIGFGICLMPRMKKATFRKSRAQWYHK